MSNPSQRRGGVVVGVDGSEAGYVAARYAAAEADRLGVRLEVVHVLPAAVPVAPEVLATMSEPSLQAHGSEILDRARKSVLEGRSAVDIETQLLSGSRVKELTRISTDASLLVLGSRSPRLVDRIWTGGTVAGLTATAPCPVVIVPADWSQQRQGRIGVGVKDPGCSSDLWDEAFPRAGESASEIVVIHAWWLGGTYDGMVASAGLTERVQHDRMSALEDELAPYREEFPGIPVHVFVRHEEPAHALVRASRGADLLVVQRPHAGGSHHLGRVVRALVRDSRCPVVVVPQRTVVKPAMRANAAGDRG